MRPEDQTVRELLREFLALHGNRSLSSVEEPVTVAEYPEGELHIRVRFKAAYPVQRPGERELREAEERGYQRGLRARQEQAETLCGVLRCRDQHVLRNNELQSLGDPGPEES